MAEEQFQKFLNKFGDHELAPSAMFGLIKSLREQNKLTSCLSRINQFQSKWPEHELAPKLYLWKGELLLEKGRLQQAEQSLKRLRFSPDTVTKEAAQYFLARCYAQQGEFQNSLDTYRKIADKKFDEKHEYRPYALYALARYQYTKSSPQKAQKAFKRLSESENVPDSLRTEAMYRLAESFFSQEEYKKAIRFYERLLVEYPQSRFASEAQKRRAWSYFSLGDYEKAVKLAKEWKSNHPGSFTYEIEYLLGASLTATGDADKALPYLKRLSKARKAPAEYRRLANFHTIRARLKRGDYEAAVQEAENFLSNFPDASSKADVHYLAGEALFRQEKFGKAAEHFRNAMASQDNEWDYYTQNGFRLAECYQRQNNFQKAAATYRQLANDLPDDNKEEKIRSILNAGRCARKTDQWQKATQDFRKVLEKYPRVLPHSRTAAKLLGETYAQHEQFDKSIEVVSELIRDAERAEEKQRLEFFLGYLYYRQGNNNKAETFLQNALTSTENSSVRNDARYFLTGALLEQDKKDEALEIFAPLLELPADKRPSFSSEFLFRLERIYFTRNRYEVSRSICRWLKNTSDPSVRYRASLRLTETYINTGKLQKAARLLKKYLKKYEKMDTISGKVTTTNPGAEISSLLGETFLKQGKKDEAVSAFSRTLNSSGVAQVHKTRANWGMAHILLQEEKYKQARDYAASAFVLGNHPLYTPRSMLIAIKALQKLENPQEARKTWKELKSRFSSFAQQHKTDKAVQTLIEDDKTDADPSQNTP